MKIRGEQLESLDEAARDDFHRRLAAYLRGELPEETAGLDDAALGRLIAEAERRAAGYGITSEAGVAQFACVTFIAGPAFDDLPLVRQYLSEPGANAEQRLAELVDGLADEE
ncbi:MAG TPA: hypothetical protein VF621_13880 [Pyrinomonadaceae bacterium]